MWLCVFFFPFHSRLNSFEFFSFLLVLSLFIRCCLLQPCTWHMIIGVLLLHISHNHQLQSEGKRCDLSLIHYSESNPNNRSSTNNYSRSSWSSKARPHRVQFKCTARRNVRAHAQQVGKCFRKYIKMLLNLDRAKINRFYEEFLFMRVIFRNISITNKNE